MVKAENLKRAVVFFVVVVMICAAFGAVAFLGQAPYAEVSAAGEKTVITLQIGNPTMFVGEQAAEIDPGRGTVPVVVDGRTLLPVLGVIEAVGGTVEWDGETNEVSLTYGGDVIRLTIDSTIAYLNDEPQTLDVAPVVINELTMLPIRFIAESFHFTVDWDGETQTVTIAVPAPAPGSSNDPDAPVVYMTTEITPEALVMIYEQLGFEPEGNVAVKMSTGEPPSSNYLRPELIKDLVQSVDGTIVECNTAYRGSRSSTAAHMQVAIDHGFTEIADVDIMDANGYLEIPVPDPKTGATSRITTNYIGANLENYDSIICLSHFKGHQMAGYGGAIKNMSIGIASSMGKAWIHSGGTSTTSTWGEQDAFLEAMADATSSVIDYMDGKIVYINVMNRLSIDCDCNGRPAEPDMHDIGILASYDPVALDQACLDLIEQAEGNTRFLNRVNQLNGYHTLEHAEALGLGSRNYNLISID